MIQATEPVLDIVTFADVWERLGKVPANRILMHPPPGTATEADVVAVRESASRAICELIDGVLVEKTMGAKESLLAIVLSGFLFVYLRKDDLGILLGADGQLRLWPGRVRVPDLCFISWERLPNQELPDEAVPELAPDLVVEVLSAGNTKKEMLHKRRDYFQSGVREVWEIQPKTQTGEIYTSPTKCHRIGKDGTLDGGAILPGFTLTLKELFAATKKRK
jgi:Uma2 family endonuclease